MLQSPTVLSFVSGVVSTIPLLDSWQQKACMRSLGVMENIFGVAAMKTAMCSWPLRLPGHGCSLLLVPRMTLAAAGGATE